MRQKFARVLRKWADLIDPRTNPSDLLSIRLEFDASQFEEGMEEIAARCLAIAKAATPKA